MVGWLVGITTVITLTAEEAGTEAETALRLLPLLLLLLLHRRDAQMNVSWYGMNAGEPRARLRTPDRQTFCACLHQLRPARPGAPCCRLPRAKPLRRRLGDVLHVGGCVGGDTVWNVTCQGRQGSPSRCNKPRLRRLRPPETTLIGSGRAAAAAAARCCYCYFCRRS